MERILHLIEKNFSKMFLYKWHRTNCPRLPSEHSRSQWLLQASLPRGGAGGRGKDGAGGRAGPLELPGPPHRVLVLGLLLVETPGTDAPRMVFRDLKTPQIILLRAFCVCRH